MDNVGNATERGEFSGIIQLDEGKVRAHLDNVVRETVEQTLNALLEAEAEALCGAKRKSGIQSAWIRVLAIMSGNCIRRQKR